MKKLLKNPLFWVVSVEIIIVTILAILGFKITYNPLLDNNWNAISACAAWVGVLSSSIAIVFAVKVPKKIAEQQNKIALFEKRYKLYKTIYPILEFGKDILKINSEYLQKSTDLQRARHYLMVYLTNEKLDFEEKNNIFLNFHFKYNEDFSRVLHEISSPNNEDISSYQKRLFKYLSNQKGAIEQSAFLFDENISVLIEKFALAYFSFMNSVCSNIYIKNYDDNIDLINEDVTMFMHSLSFMEENKKNFLEVIEEIEKNNILQRIEKEINISNIK